MAHSSFSSSLGVSLGIRISRDSLRAIHQSWDEMESYCLVCNITVNRLLGRKLRVFILYQLVGFDFRLVTVSPFGFGCFRLQLESSIHENYVLE